MDHGLTIMIYGAIMGVVDSILTSLPVFVGSVLADLTDDALPVCSLTALLGFHFARRVTRALQA